MAEDLPRQQTQTNELSVPIEQQIATEWNFAFDPNPNMLSVDYKFSDNRLDALRKLVTTALLLSGLSSSNTVDICSEYAGSLLALSRACAVDNATEASVQEAYEAARMTSAITHAPEFNDIMNLVDIMCDKESRLDSTRTGPARSTMVGKIVSTTLRQTDTGLSLIHRLQTPSRSNHG